MTSKGFKKEDIQILISDKKGLQYLIIREEAAYLYDAVMLYARSLKEVLIRSLGSPFNGSLIIQQILNKSYMSALGHETFMDGNGDAMANYSLCSFNKGNLQAIGRFHVVETSQTRAELRINLTKPILWAGGQVPLAIPICGFNVI